MKSPLIAKQRQYYIQLKWLLQANQIKYFELQPRFLLQDKFVKNGKTFRKIEYIADFKVFRNDGSIDIIDIKRAETKEFSFSNL